MPKNKSVLNRKYGRYTGNLVILYRIEVIFCALYQRTPVRGRTYVRAAPSYPQIYSP